MLPDIACPECGRDVIADKGLHDSPDTLPSFLPQNMEFTLPLVLWQWACISCGWEQCVARGPNGAAVWSRTWPKGKRQERKPP